MVEPVDLAVAGAFGLGGAASGAAIDAGDAPLLAVFIAAE